MNLKEFFIPKFLENVPPETYLQSVGLRNFSDIHLPATKGICSFIDRLGDDSVGLQIGISEANDTCYLLQHCPLIKRMDLVDKYEEYIDYICGNGVLHSENQFNSKIDYSLSDNMYEAFKINQDEMNEEYNTAVNNLILSGYVDKVILYKMDSEEFLKYIKDEYYDFIILDAHLSYNHAYRDMQHWYSKVKIGGIFALHDYMCPEIYSAIKNFRNHNHIEDKGYRYFCNGYLWFKGLKNGISDLKT
jgi:hypothetical protein